MPVKFNANTKMSPRRQIFNIDTFLGVDFTNSGTNMDEVRSPNAENMVRLVPGKVRKRTGYKTDVLFHTTDDVNRARDTSDEWSEYLGENGEETIISFYGDEIPLTNGDCLYAIYLDVDVVGNYSVYVDFTTGDPLEVTITGERNTPIAFCSFPDDPDTLRTKPYRIRIERDSYTEGNYFKIKSVRVCSTTKATTLDEWGSLPWSSAPEDNDGIWIKNDYSKPVYGCHTLTSGTNVGNRVVNVNRVLDTSSSFETFTVTDTLSDIYSFAEQFYCDGERYTTVQIDFDYVSSETVYLYIYEVNGENHVFTLPDSEGVTAHFSREYTLGSYKPYKIGLKQRDASTTIQIKNMSVMYQKDDNYEWSAAPEDNDGVFHIEDIYTVDAKNTANRDRASMSSTEPAGSTTDRLFFTIQNNSSHSEQEGFVKVSFYVYTTCTEPVDSIEVYLTDRSSHECAISRKVFNRNLNDLIEFYGSADCSRQAINFIQRVNVKFNYSASSSSVKSTVTLDKIKVQKITLKDDYDLSAKHYIYHVGKELYHRTKASDDIEKIYTDANEELSQSWQINDKLIILDGKNLYRYTINEPIELLAENGYIPLATIGKAPNGGGTSYEPINMLQPGFYEQFTVDTDSATATKFYLSFNNLDQTEVQAWILDNTGVWQAKVENTDFTVNRQTGVVTFSTAPGVSPISGEDNVRILAYKTVSGYADRVTKCTIGTLYGINGAMDRLFLSGNPAYPNWDFFSEQNDPTYFPDTGYSVIGNASSGIVGYAIINGYLATFKNKIDDTPAVFIRQGELIKNAITDVSEPVFRLVNTLLGDGVISPYAFGNLPTEPLFLTKLGVYAITPQDITGEKYSQKRSFYLDGKLTKEKNLQKAKAVIFKDQYVLSVNDNLYILDGLQATRTDKSEPYATRQYAGFYCTHVPAFTMWVDDDALWIGTEDGNVCRFSTYIDSLDAYNDNGRRIYCCWETPDLDGALFYKKKNFKYFALRLRAALRTSVKLYAMKFGLWSYIDEDLLTGIYFDFEHVDFERFSFGTDATDKVISTKMRVRRVDKARFRVENDKLNEPLGLLDLALEYTESGNYKGW